jgi:hypothetical protein
VVALADHLEGALVQAAHPAEVAEAALAAVVAAAVRGALDTLAVMFMRRLQIFLEVVAARLAGAAAVALAAAAVAAAVRGALEVPPVASA